MEDRHKHGTERRYRLGCRCDLCKASNTERCRELRRKRKARLTEGNFEHGASGYNNWGCRCDVCGDAHRKILNKHQKERVERTKSGIEPAKHGHLGYTAYGCRCDVCRAAVAQYQREKYHEGDGNRGAEYQRAQYASNQTYRDRSIQASVASRAKRQDTTRERASRHGYEWTGPELEILGRDDLTVTEKALLLGRTYAAVTNQLQLLRKQDPRTVRLAGIPKDPDQLG